MREDGYYWVKVKESVSDKGGPCCDEWIIELCESGEWACWYASDDSSFSEIDERRIERGE